MGASYNFDDNDLKFVKRIRQTRFSLILLLITSGIQIITSLISIALLNDLSASLTIWIIELLSFFVNIPALFMLLFGIDELRDKIDNNKKSPLRGSLIFLGIYIGYYLISTIVMLIIEPLVGFYTGLLVSKDLMCFVFISIALLFISLAFNKMSTQNYPTRLLLAPLILLPLNAVVGFAIGWSQIFINSFTHPYAYPDGNAMSVLTISIFIFLSVSLFISMLEFFVVFNKMHNEILLNLAPDLLLKKEKKKTKVKVDKVVETEKAVTGK
jgi:hypothetical protein